MRKNIILLLLLFLVAVTGAAQSLPQDGSYRVGKLRNGLTYYIRHNAKEAGIADFYIAQRVGSILEEPRQRGLAHFLEHMAFNGSQNFQGTAESPSIVHWCEAHGVKFGANLNAYTSVDETVYHVSAVPVKQQSVIDSTLLILHDWSHYLNLTGTEIDKERGVIHEEWRNRRSGMAVQRLMEQAMPIIYKGSKYADCMPIGSMDIVDNFPYNDLRDYYHKWYRPDLQAIIVVGDIDVDQMEQKIKQTFGSIPMPENPAKRIYYPVPDNDKMIVAKLKDAEQPIMLVNLYMKKEATPDNEKNSKQYMRDNYIDALISYMAGERLNEMQEASPKPCLSASAQLGMYFVSKTKDAFNLAFGARQDNIKGSFDAAVGVVERIRQHGFTQSELDRAKAFSSKRADRSWQARNDRRNSYYVRLAQANFLNGEPLLSAEESKSLNDEFSKSVTLAEVNKAMKAAITDKNQVLVVYMPDKPDFTSITEQQLEQYVLDAQAKKYPAYKETPAPTKLMAKTPKPGRIVSEKPSVNGTTELTLSNGVKVYYRRTNYQADYLMTRLWGEGGSSLYPAADMPNMKMISTAISEAGVGNLSKSDLDKVLASKTVRIRAGVGEETQSINGTSSLKDAETLFQLTYLYFTQPRRDDKAFANEVDRMRSFLTNRNASPKVSYNDSIVYAVYGDNPRTNPFVLADLDKVSYDRVLQIYKERFADASGFRMMVIGNISLDSLRPLLTTYIASLPAKGHIDKTVDNFPAIVDGMNDHEWTRDTKTPQSKVTVIYTWQEPVTAKNDLTLDALRRVLSIAYVDSVREEKGGVYGISTEASIDATAKPTGMLKLSFTTGPDKYRMVMPIVLQQLQNIADHGPLDVSLNKVKEYLTKQYGQAVITNDYWNYVIYNNLRYGIDYDKDYLKMVNDMTADDLQQMARHIVNSHRRIIVTMHSVAKKG